MTTPFEYVQQFNRAFGVMPNSLATYKTYGDDRENPYVYARFGIFQEDPACVKLRISLITEEIGELATAVAVNDRNEIRDALIDIAYVVYGMADVFGIELDLLATQLNRTLVLDHVPRTSLQVYLAELKHNEHKLIKNISRGDFYKAAEILYVIINIVYGAYAFLKLSFIEDFMIVHRSNMSKLCDTEADAVATVESYAAKIAAGDATYDSPYYYAIPELGKWGVKNRSTGKILKNVKYVSVAFA